MHVQELPIVVIQKCCQDSNVTSHFSSLFSKERDIAPLKHKYYGLTTVYPMFLWKYWLIKAKLIKGLYFEEN